MSSIKYPGSFTEYVLVYEKYPETEFDPNGIPYGIQPDYSNPYLDINGKKRSVFVYRPSSMQSMMTVHAMIVLTADGNPDGFDDCLVRSGLLDLSEKEGFFLFFCVSDDGWALSDTSYLTQLVHAVSLSCIFSGRERCHDYKIAIVAEGNGSAVAHLAAAQNPGRINSILTFGGNIDESALYFKPDGAFVTVWAVNPGDEKMSFWYKANRLNPAETIETADSFTCTDRINRSHQVKVFKYAYNSFNQGIILRFWNEIYKWNIKPFSTERGRTANILDALELYKPCIHLNDRSLGDNGFAAHDWLEFIPESVRDHNTKVPMILFLHGGACDAFIEAANTSLHVLGEKEHFITVYATATNGYSWNNVLSNNRENDIDFLEALIKHMCACYPVDISRVYISGFSNGSGMAQTFAALRPSMIAGVLAFNTRFRPNDALYAATKDVKAYYDFRMPVYYSYGTKDAEYPLTEGCAQYAQMEFWSKYNHIECTPSEKPEFWELKRSANREFSWGIDGSSDRSLFHTHQFDSSDPKGVNLYNYTIVNMLPHAVETRLFPAGLAFLSRFSRNLDGSLCINEKRIEEHYYTDKALYC